ncbi:hypothetical protein MKW98_013678 [Papaver atlanticum]|uniref:Uncharacterized protein n=1 Tax=Papaver atlanticum TaxID=357466 RepID=A0AAD4XTR4_9MAGN|nr:hypothetical protein MKW98_013678 [Papaver atlanticum]
MEMECSGGPRLPMLLAYNIQDFIRENLNILDWDDEFCIAQFFLRSHGSPLYTPPATSTNVILCMTLHDFAALDSCSCGISPRFFCGQSQITLVLHRVRRVVPANFPKIQLLDKIPG